VRALVIHSAGDLRIEERPDEAPGPGQVLVRIAALRPRGVVLQLGLGGDMTVPMMAVTAKELDVRGSFRFHEEFVDAVALMQRGIIDASPLVTRTFPLDDALQAFRLVCDRVAAVKVQIAFS
jgi:L-idonate 5-dehydrogenase